MKSEDRKKLTKETTNGGLEDMEAPWNCNVYLKYVYVECFTFGRGMLRTIY